MTNFDWKTVLYILGLPVFMIVFILAISFIMKGGLTIASKIEDEEEKKTNGEKADLANLKEEYKDVRIPLGLKIAAIYLIVSGVIGSVWPILGFGPHHTEFTTQSIAYKFGAYAREVTFSVLFFVSGIGIFYRKSWARKLALVLLVLSTIYSATSFAWGFARGRPSTILFIASYVVVGLWNGLWFYLIYRKTSANYF